MMIVHAHFKNKTKQNKFPIEKMTFMSHHLMSYTINTGTTQIKLFNIKFSVHSYIHEVNTRLSS